MQIPLRKPAAVAKLRGGAAASGLSGMVRFYQLTGGVLVEADVTGLPGNTDGFFGFHIHSGGDCSGDGFPFVGSHYDPVGVPHPRHAGDLPPLLSRGGRAWLAVITDRFSVADIIGRTVLIHEMTDDFHSQPSGNAGGKIACGVIEGRGQVNREILPEKY